MLKKQLLAASLALALTLSTPLSALANSGGIFYPNGSIPGFGFDAYIGNYQASSGNASGGNVIINSDFTGNVYGGYSNTGSATYNNVVVTGSTVTGFVYGGWSTNGSATYNNVVVTGSTVTSNVFGGYSVSGSANNNSVTIKDSKVTSDVYGGYSTSGSANNNSVLVTSSTVAGFVYGGNSRNGAANYNSVLVTGSTVGSVFGGYSDTGSANYNSVTIKDSKVSTNVFGGYLLSAGASSTATNNTVTLLGNNTFDASTGLYGGFDRLGSGADFRTGNTLRVFTTGVVVSQIANFQHYELALSGVPAIHATGNATLGNGAQNGTVTIPLAMQAQNLKVGDTVQLVTAGGTLDITNLSLDPSFAKQGIALGYGYTLTNNANTLAATINSKGILPESKIATQARTSSMLRVNSGADLLAGRGLYSAVSGAKGADAFAAMSYGKQELSSTGLDTQGTALIFGWANNWGEKSKNTFGVFVEAGWATNDNTAGGVSADGRNKYYGLGVLSKKQLPNGVYSEGSIRAGRTDSTFSLNSIFDGDNSFNSNYYGAHLGIGKVRSISENTSLDLYSKLLYTNQSSGTVNFAGDNFDLKAVNSLRLRLGGRVNKQFKNGNAYAGLAYEYEFDGKSKATAYGYQMLETSMKGSTGLIELGTQLKTSKDSNFTADLSVNGYVGKRQGLSLNAQLNWGL